MTSNRKISSIYGKKFKLKDFLLNIVLYLSFILVSIIFAFFFFHVFSKGLEFFNLKLIFDRKDGILPFIINTIYVVVLTLLIATPIGVGCSIYLTQYCKKESLFNFISFTTNILASIPSILFGLFGFSLFCVGFGAGQSILAGTLTLCCAVLPNIIETTKESLLAVPSSYKSGALALGASKFKVIFNLIVPSALPGILTALILSAGKIIGESASLLLTIGGSNRMPEGFLSHIFESGKTLTLHLYYTAGAAVQKNSIELCYSTAIVLIIFSLVLNILAKSINSFFKK